jgi:colicin import membrane protein
VRFGLAVSSILHAALLLWALVSVHSSKPLDLPKPEAVVADIITPSELNKLRQGSQSAKLDEAAPQEAESAREPKKEAPKRKPVAAPPPPAAEPPPAPKEEPTPPEPTQTAEPPPPPPQPKAAEPPPPPPDKDSLEKKLEEIALEKAAEEQRKVEAAAKAKAEAEAKAKAEAQAKAKAEADAKAKAIAKAKADKAKAEAKARAEAKAKAEADAKAREKTKLDGDRLAALLDKTPDQAQPPAAAPAATPSKAKGPVRGDRSGRDSLNAANEASMLLGMIVGRVKDCWTIQAGGELASGQVPRIQFDLNRDGSLRGEPRVLNPQSSPHFQLAADAAKSAVVKCQNYDLPPDKYDLWKRVTLDFDPREMFQ